MSAPLTDEQARILVAIDEGRMHVNNAGRYVIDYEERPDRKSREQLRGRKLIVDVYEQGRGTHWRLTAKGKATLAEELKRRRQLRADSSSESAHPEAVSGEPTP